MRGGSDSTIHCFSRRERSFLSTMLREDFKIQKVALAQINIIVRTNIKIAHLKHLLRFG